MRLDDQADYDRDPRLHREAALPVAAAALFAAAFAVLAVMVVGGGPLPIDTSIRTALGVGGPVPPLLQALNTVGGAITWDIGVAVVAGILFVAARRREAVVLAGGVVLGEALATGAKLLVDRQRPPGISVQDLVTQASFPSGHATRTAITAGLLVLLLARGRWARVGGAAVAVVLALAMGLARILSGEHWPTDVLGAYLIAGVVLLVAAAVPARIRESAPAHPLPEPLGSTGAAPRP